MLQNEVDLGCGTNTCGNSVRERERERERERDKESACLCVLQLSVKFACEMRKYEKSFKNKKKLG